MIEFVISLCVLRKTQVHKFIYSVFPLPEGYRTVLILNKCVAMLNICAVFRRNSHGRRKEGISFFHFPKDAKTRQKLIDLCRRKDKFNYPSSRICSRHFEERSYSRNQAQHSGNVTSNSPRTRLLKVSCSSNASLTQIQRLVSMSSNRLTLL